MSFEHADQIVRIDKGKYRNSLDHEEQMEELIGSLVGKKIDVNCGSSAVFRGESVAYANGVLTLKDETGRIVYIDGTRIVAISEVTDGGSRPGFIA